MGSVTRKHLFDLPEGIVYLDGNSLGALPRNAAARARKVIEEEWGGELIRAWNSADWMDLPRRVGDRIAGLIGAPRGSVATGDTLSIKLYQALAAALEMRPGRRVVLSDSGNFPTDLYMAEGLLATAGGDRVLRTPPPEAVGAHITDEVAAVMLTHVDYRTGRMHDMGAITRAAHAAGAVMIWDLAHSAGAMPVDIAACGAEFAVGCSYKYLNGGPGAPAFIFVRPDIVGDVTPALAGWMGHAAPFAMEHGYRPAPSTERLRIGTPPIVQLSILDAALDVWEGVDLADIRAASIDLGELFIAEVEARCPQLDLAAPRDAARRGSQVSFRFEQGHAAMQALIAGGVIGDFRAPDIMRFGFTPLYVDADDVRAAAAVLERTFRDGLWRDPKYRIRSRVT